MKALLVPKQASNDKRANIQKTKPHVIRKIDLPAAVEADTTLTTDNLPYEISSFYSLSAEKDRVRDRKSKTLQIKERYTHKTTMEALVSDLFKIKGDMNGAIAKFQSPD